MGESKPCLLVVLPGAEGRLAVVERLQAVAEIFVLVDRADLARSAWAEEVVGRSRWIEFDGSTAATENAVDAVEAWLRGGADGEREEKESSGKRQKRHIDGAFTYDEFGIDICAAVCERLGLPCTPHAIAREARDKTLFRERCRLAGLPVPQKAHLQKDGDVEALLTAENEAAKWTWFPAVLKPAKGGGSWYTIKVDSPDNLRQQWKQLSADISTGSFPQYIKDGGFILEEYFEGHEVDIDGWVRHGKVEFSLVSDNKPALEPFFLECGGAYPSQLPSETIAALQKMLHDVFAAFSGLHCCFHFEAKINLKTGRIMPIEINARTGGAECPGSVEAVTGYYLPFVAGLLALDKPIPPPQAASHAVVASTNIHVLKPGTVKRCSDKGVDRVATKVVTCQLIESKVGKAHVPSNGSLSCMGWLSTGGATIEEANANLRLAASQVDIVVVAEDGETVLDVITP